MELYSNTTFNSVLYIENCWRLQAWEDACEGVCVHPSSCVFCMLCYSARQYQHTSFIYVVLDIHYIIIIRACAPSPFLDINGCKDEQDIL